MLISSRGMQGVVSGGSRCSAQLTADTQSHIQEVTDEQGRRRFHGAFTGGYSAGFYNTVGSLEGWTPSQFTSSRDGRAGAR